MSKSELESKSQRDHSGALRSSEEQAAFMDGALHLLDYLAACVKEAVKIRTFRFNPQNAKAYNDGYNQGCKDMLENLKSYCGRE